MCIRDRCTFLTSHAFRSALAYISWTYIGPGFILPLLCKNDALAWAPCTFCSKSMLWPLRGAFFEKCKTCALAPAWCPFLEKWASRLRAVHIFEVRCSWPVLGPSWALLGLPRATPGSLLGPLLASLGLCWSVLASSGFSGAHFWPSLGLIRGVKTRGE